MTERLLQFIWQFQYFNRNQLATTAGEAISIIHPGTLNHHQGPDFLDARLQLGNTTWVGNIELHVISSDWQLHGHSNDRNYGNIILHVVWQEDEQLDLPFPVLELQSKVSGLLLARYDALMKAQTFIACETMFAQVPQLTWLAWKERLMIERLQKKSTLILQSLEQNQYHWEESFWWLIARNFGFTVNSDAFEKIARSVSLTILSKHKHQLHQAEALLFGQAGLLENVFEEEYPRMLQKEYHFYQNKYNLQPVVMPLHFLRMRPSNFPTVRLAQLAMLVHNSVHLFAQTREINQLKDIRALLNVTANDYWHYHYRFDELTDFKEKKLGKQMSDSIIINTIIPILFTYGHFRKEDVYKDKAIGWLQEMSPENNHITQGFLQLGIDNNNAFDSQALIQLKNEYCNQKRCIECAVGNNLLKENQRT